MHLKTLTAALAALLLAACNPMAQLNEAEAQVESFHDTYNEGDARALYGLTGEPFREVTSAQDMVDLVALVDERMGKVVSSEREGININSDNGTTTTTVTMKTEFEKGEATETFIFMGSGEDMGLVGWNVDSPNFMGPAEPAELETYEVEAPPPAE